MERKVLKAREGYVYTNGEIFGETIYLAKDVDESKFYEITKEEYREMIMEEADGVEENE